MMLNLRPRALGAFTRQAAITVGAIYCALASLTASAQTLKDQVQREGRVTIGFHNVWPWGMTASNGSVTGLHPEVLQAVVEQLSVKKIDSVVMDFGALIPSLQSKRIDAVASGMNITPARCQQVLFSEPFMASGDTVLVKKGNPHNIHSYADLANNPKFRVGDQRGASTTPNALAAGVRTEQIQLYPDAQAVIAALMAGRIDAALFATGTALGYLRDPALAARLERAAPFQGLMKDGKEQVAYAAIAFRKEDSDFVVAYNKALAQKKADGTVAKILGKYGFTSETDLVPASVTTAAICGG